MNITNIMTVDLEDYFCDLEFSEWSKYESRVIKNTEYLLDVFDKFRVNATFFTLGYIAEKFPELIKKISKKGHEIASHGYAHKDVRKITPIEFEKDLVKSIKILQDVSGKRIKGFRAPFFSINKTSSWAFDILRKHIKYDSSLFPVKTPLYGEPHAPMQIYRPSRTDPFKNDDKEFFHELPLTVHKFLFLPKIPVSGGFFFRFFPYFYLKYAFKSVNKKNIPVIFYIHPKDIDKNFPRIPQYSWHYYYGLTNAKKKFEKILSDFKFTNIENLLGFENSST